MKNRCCCPTERPTKTDETAETVRIAQTPNSCRLCEDYAARQKTKLVAVLCCEGACLRGEVARQAANRLCHELAPEQTVRICLGGAFTKDSGQRELVRRARRVLALEGCPVNCATRMMQGVIAGLNPEIVAVDRLYDFDRSRFGIDELAPEEIQAHARSVAQQLAATLYP